MGSKIRKFFVDLFGSRVIASLELQLIQLRQDFEQRLLDQGQIIADLRADKAVMQGRMMIYENTIMPLASRAGAQVVAASNPLKPKPHFPAEMMVDRPKTKWELVQEEHDKMLADLDRQEAEAKAAKQAAQE
jgi:hypothetical protein